MQRPRYIPVDSHKRPHYSTAVANSLSCSIVSPVIICNTRNATGEREITDVLQEEEKKTAETEVGRLQKERKWRLQRGAIERPSVGVVKEPKRRSTNSR